MGRPKLIRIVCDTYPETIHWRKRYFQVPLESTGKAFVSELAKLFTADAENSAVDIIALEAVSVACILLLPRPHGRCNAKEHQARLAHRKQLWQNGRIEELVFERRFIQQGLHTPRTSAVSNSKLACSFSNLMFP